MIEIKNLINQIKNTVEKQSVDNIKKKSEYQRLKINLRKYQRIQGTIKSKINKHDYSLQELWDTKKRQNIRIYGAEERAQIQTKDIENLFNEIIA